MHESKIRKDFEHFIKALKIAGGRMIDPHYFKLPVAEGEPVFRERVYCYELYHQLRCVLGDHYPYKLDGEVDKAGHPKFDRSYKPDFIIHVPGDFNRNLVIMEVKSIKSIKDDDVKNLKEDIRKIKYFVNRGHYHYSVVLIYGDGTQEKLSEHIINRARRFIGNYRDRIYLIWHKGPGEEPKVIKL